MAWTTAARRRRKDTDTRNSPPDTSRALRLGHIRSGPDFRLTSFATKNVKHLSLFRQGLVMGNRGTSPVPASAPPGARARLVIAPQQPVTVPDPWSARLIGYRRTVGCHRCVTHCPELNVGCSRGECRCQSSTKNDVFRMVRGNRCPARWTRVPNRRDIQTFPGGSAGPASAWGVLSVTPGRPLRPVCCEG